MWCGGGNNLIGYICMVLDIRGLYNIVYYNMYIYVEQLKLKMEREIQILKQKEGVIATN